MRGDLAREIAVTAQLHQTRRAAPFSRSSAKYAERLPVASMMARIRRSTALGAAVRHVREQRRQQGLQALAPGLIGLRTRARRAAHSSRRGDFRAVAESARASASTSAAVSPDCPRTSQIDAHGAPVGLSPALHYQAKVLADPCACS